MSVRILAGVRHGAAGKSPCAGLAMKCSAAELIAAVRSEPRLLPAQPQPLSAKIAF